MNILEFEITIGRKINDYWPINVRINNNGDRNDLLNLKLKMDCTKLRAITQDKEYGEFLGKALFGAPNKDMVQELRDKFKEYLGISSTRDCPLRILLSIDNAEDEDLTTVTWQKLCAPIDGDGTWSPLALDQRVPFSMYIPTPISRSFPLLRREDLRALVLVASPDDLRKGLAHFDVQKVVSDLRTSLGDIPHKFLANGIDNKDRIGAPTLKNLCQQLTDAKPRYNLLHIVCHGTLGQYKDTTLYWADENNKEQLVSGKELIKNLREQDVLPHFVFLCTCNSAAAKAEVAKEGETPLGGLAQRLVRQLAIPAVVAMTREVTIETASNLTNRFYKRLRESGEVDVALKEATAGLADRSDITVPVLFSRLGARPLFISDERFKQDLQPEQIEEGIKKLDNLFKEHSPLALKEEFEQQKPLLIYAEKRREVLKKLNNLCYQVFDLTFDELATGKEPPEYEVKCPFPGLSSFGQEEFHDFFFGREALIQDLKKVFESGENFLAVLGNSGTGKSSLVLAGLIPALKKEQKELNVKCITPGNEPLEKLEAAINELSGNSAILVVDQFEEIFTFRSSEGIQKDQDQKDREIRKEFIKKMLEFARSQKVVITMRADFLGECANYNDLKTQINNKKNFILVGPMETKELAEVIQKQANTAGLRFEAGLNTLILAEVEQEPGAMPLLQYALKLLYEKRCGRWLCDEDYHKIGGVRKAIATIADKFYNSLRSEAEKEQVKNIFLRLTYLKTSLLPDDKPKYMRKRVYLKDLSPYKDDYQTVEEIKKLVDRLAGEEARLLVKSGGGENQEDQVTVEVAHEALMNHWPKFKEWWAENQVNLQLRQSIQQVLSQWQETKKDESLLMRGSQLDAAKELLKQKDFLNEEEVEYVEASIEAQNRQEGEKLEQVIATHTAYSQLLFVSNRRLDALAELIKTGEKLQGEIKISEAEKFRFLVTFGQIFAEVEEFNSLKGHKDQVSSVVFSPDCTMVASASYDKTIKLWKRDGSLIQTLSGHGGYVIDLSFSTDGKFLASASADMTIKIWQKQEMPQAETMQQPSQWVLVKTLKHSSWVLTVSFSPNGNVIASGTLDKTIILWHYQDGDYLPTVKILGDTDIGHRDRVVDVAFSPDGTMVASASRDKTVKLWSLEGELLKTFAEHEATVTSVTFSADGKTLISSSDDKTIIIWEIEGSDYELENVKKPVKYVAASRIDQKIAAATEDGNIIVYHKDNNYLTKIRTLQGHRDKVYTVSFSSDSSIIASCSSDKTIKFWHGCGKFEDNFAEIISMDFSADGQTIAIASKDSTVKLWDCNGKLKQTLLLDNSELVDVKFNRYAGILATACEDGTIKFWSLEGELLETKIFPSNDGNELRNISFSPDGEMMALVSGTTVIVRNLDGTTYRILKGHQSFVRGVNFSLDSKTVATFSRDEIKVWHLQEESPRPLDINTENDIIAVGFTKSNMLAFLRKNQTLELRHINGELLQSQNINEENYETLNVASFRADGSAIVVANLERKIKLWFLNLDEILNNTQNLLQDYLRLQQ